MRTASVAARICLHLDSAEALAICVTVTVDRMVVADSQNTMLDSEILAIRPMEVDFDSFDRHYQDYQIFGCDRWAATSQRLGYNLDYSWDNCRFGHEGLYYLVPDSNSYLRKKSKRNGFDFCNLNLFLHAFG